ncbi:MAG TPA: hypothetical protein VMU03_18330 [Gammaproteobacteria bacterium]|nr:hypothetical protein [Gammaproteobacteria bacterium]
MGCDVPVVDRGRGRAGPRRASACSIALVASLWLATSAEAQTLLFRSGFEPDTAVRPVTQTDCSSSGCRQLFEPGRSDQTTGFTWPPVIWGGSESQFLLLPDTITDAATIHDEMFNQIVTVTGHDGQPTHTLYSQVTHSGCCGADPQGPGTTQNELAIMPAREPPGVEGDLYISYWLKFQEGLKDLMQVGTEGSGWHWRSPFEWKTDGDYRVTLHIRRDPYINGGALFWRLIGDNDANGGLPYHFFWHQVNTSVPVPVGEWFKFEVFWHRSLDSDGRVWVAIQRAGQPREVVFDRLGRNMASSNPLDSEYGFADSPRSINRILLNILYTSTSYPIYEWMDDLEIWTGIPSP